MANTVRNLLGPPLRLRGPVTRADGGKTGVGRGYGGARIELESLSTTDPHSRQLLAAQIIWTLARAGINGPYVINADGAALDDRFADGWEASDVAATDPARPTAPPAGSARAGGRVAGVARRAAGATRVPGSFGADARPDGGRAVAQRAGGRVGGDAPARRARTWRRRCGSAPIGGDAVQAIDGRSLSRPTWSLDDAVWVVVDGNNVMRVIQEARPGQPGRIPVDSTAVATRFPGADHRTAAVPRRHPRGDGHRGPGDPGRRRADPRRRVRADVSAPAGVRAGQHRWCRCRGAPATTSWSAATIRNIRCPTSTSTASTPTARAATC